MELSGPLSLVVRSVGLSVIPEAHVTDREERLLTPMKLSAFLAWFKTAFKFGANNRIPEEEFPKPLEPR